MLEKKPSKLYITHIHTNRNKSTALSCMPPVAPGDTVTPKLPVTVSVREPWHRCYYTPTGLGKVTIYIGDLSDRHPPYPAPVNNFCPLSLTDETNESARLTNRFFLFNLFFFSFFLPETASNLPATWPQSSPVALLVCDLHIKPDRHLQHSSNMAIRRRQ